MKGLHKLAHILLIIGGLNWLLIGLFNWGVADLVGMDVAKIIYIIYFHLPQLRTLHEWCKKSDA